jgi:hypothetical protein
MRIQILSVQITTVPTAKGSYQVADVAFKNLTYQGKVEGKKVMSFGATKPSFEVLATAQTNDIYEVTVVKNDKNYNDWVSMTKGDANTPTQQAPTGQSPAGNAPARTSTYETPEERAKKQVYIVRQSSLSNAIDSLSVGGKSALKPDEVIDLARKYEAYVFGSTAIPAPESFPDESFPDMPQ